MTVPPVSTTPSPAQQPHFAILICVSWLLAVGQLMGQNWASTAVTLPDPDDAMRLVQVRDFLAGHGWFDLHNARFNPPWGYDSHWSRLVDAGLAGLFLFFNQFADVPLAERLMCSVWPVLWLLPSIGAVAAIAWRVGGRETAIIALLLAAFNNPGFEQFRPGRIDHHNIHIALTLLTTAAAVWADRMRWCVWTTGGLTGLAIAIGFEALPFYVLFGVYFITRFIIDRAAAAELNGYASALLASTLASFLVTVRPERWTNSVCDMIAVNSTAAVTIVSVGLLLAVRFFANDHLWWMRLSVCGASVGAAILAFTLFEPRCLAGPYGLIDPAIRPIWLDNIAEAESLFRLFQISAVTAIAMASFPTIAVMALLLIIRISPRPREVGFLVAAASFLLAFVTMLTVVRGYSYAIWLGLPFVAGAANQLFAKHEIKRLLPRCVIALFFTPTAISMCAILVTQSVSNGKLLNLSPALQACVARENYAPLARLPVGLVVLNSLELAPYLLAWTPQLALAAPYHRISAAILAAHQALALPPQDARSVITHLGINYVAICGPEGPENISQEERERSLWKQLQAGTPPDWLVKLPESRDNAFVVYRVKH